MPSLPARSTRASTGNRLTSESPQRPSAEPKVVTRAVAVEAKSERPIGRRRLFFRCARLVLTGAVVAGAGAYVTHTLTSVSSEQAYINAEMTVLRAPIEGQLRLEPVRPGAVLFRGATLFRIENPRFGNQEAMAQLNWLGELTERLHAEADEAAVRCQQQEQVYRLHEKLHQEKLISRLAFLEEETKLALARTALSNRLTQARQAAERAGAIERQVELQKEAMVQMPFDGVAWTIPAKTDGQVAAHEPVLQVIDPRRIWVDAFFHEKHAQKLRPGAPVTIRALDRRETWHGHVESIRGGVGRIAYEGFTAGLPGDFARRRVAVRVVMESNHPYDASQFFGVGRSVVVTVNDHE
jgi:membrane fusion protein (multidrug efflux system)